MPGICRTKHKYTIVSNSLVSSEHSQELNQQFSVKFDLPPSIGAVHGLITLILYPKICVVTLNILLQIVQACQVAQRSRPGCARYQQPVDVLQLHPVLVLSWVWSQGLCCGPDHTVPLSCYPMHTPHFLVGTKSHY